MCWYCTGEIRKKTARKNIPVFKVMNDQSKNQDIRNIVTSIYQKFEYVLGKQYELPEIDVKSNTHRGMKTFSIYEGFHSYNQDKCRYEFANDRTFYIKSSLSSTQNPYNFRLIDRFSFLVPVCVVNGYIPKGSTYYENKDGEIVSNRIVLENVVGHFNQGMLKVKEY